MDKRRAKILLGMSIIIILISIYVFTFDPFIGSIGLVVGLVTLFNSYQESQGRSPKFIEREKNKEENRLKQEEERETMYTRQRRLNNEKYQKKREEQEKEDKFNL
ncbi:MAG TPA: hypothetical protein VK107_00205 [Alloiococcus sp.]|nr:hypothetical protein [Alloiococcus sp.]